jgi:GAF domain-containing protein
MKRRSKVSGRQIKGRREKTPDPKRRNVPKVEIPSKSTSVAEEKEVTRLARERDEALEQLIATSIVLHVISTSRGELEPVFQIMLERAVRICEAKLGALYRFNGNALHLAAQVGASREVAEFRASRGPFQPTPDGLLDRVLRTKRVNYVADQAIEASGPVAELSGARSSVCVPMLRDDALVGVIAIYRQEVRPFTEKQIALVENFAAQAVIAIENARLLSELRQRTSDLTKRTADLTEALEQQTATSEVLQAISSFPAELEQVFTAMLEKAVHICDAAFGNIYRWDGDALQLVAGHNTPPAFAEARKRLPLGYTPGSALRRAISTKAVVHIADLVAEQEYIERSKPTLVAAVELGGVRTLIVVPMLKENEPIGAFALSRQEVHPFTDKQIELVKNFAAQAVIAVENARLLNELRQSLDQQTATSEVLQVISSAPGELEPVFAAMLEKAARICEAKFAALYRLEGNGLRLTATYNVPQAFAEAQGTLFRPAPGGALDAVLKTGRTAHLSDLAAARSYVERHPRMVEAVEIAGIRTTLGVPMIKENTLLGIIGIFRQEVRPFNDKQVALVTNFAAQAVIAIENARLLKELHERTAQLQMRSQELAKLNQELEGRVADQVDEIERMSRLRRFLPPQVADLIVASGTEKQLESHRREITALFCDLRGFSGFTEAADAEDVMALLREYHAAVGEKIIKYSGTLERYAGDGVMVVFNDPVPVENPALQAVLMALEMREAIGGLTSKWRRFGHDIGFGIGVAHGYATLGTIGFEGRFDYAAIGTVSNVASRLCDEAKPGQILISPRVLVAVEDAVQVEPVGEFELKGIRRPLAAYNVLGAVSGGA